MNDTCSKKLIDAYPDKQTLVRLANGVLLTSRAISNQYARAPDISAMKSFDVTWHGPMTDMILRANELPFRIANAISSMSSDITAWADLDDSPDIVSPDLTVTLRSSTRNSTVFACFPFLTYWGWWRLGRDVGISPLEIACH